MKLSANPISGRRVLTVTALTLLPALFAGTALLESRSADALRRQEDTTAYTLQRVYKAGEVDRYKMEIHANVNVPQLGNNEINMKMTIKETTKEVKPDGIVTLTEECEDAVVKFGETEQTITDLLPHTTQKRDKTGRILESKSEGGGGPLTEAGDSIPKMFMQAASAFFAPKPIKIGESWAIEMSDPKDKDTKVTGKSTFVGTEMIGDVKTLKIKAIFEATGNALSPGGGKASAKMNFEGIGNVDPKTSKLVRMNGTVDGNVGPLGKSKIEIKMNLITGEPKANPEKKTGEKKTDEKKP